MKNILKKTVSELKTDEIEEIIQHLIEAREILNDAVNCSVVCNVTDYNSMRANAYQYLAKE